MAVPALSPDDWYSTAEAAELAGVERNTMGSRFRTHRQESPDDGRLRKATDSDQRGRPGWEVQGSLLTEILQRYSPPPSLTDVGELQTQVAALTAEVASLRAELQTFRDNEVTGAMALSAELDEMKRKYRALAEVVAIDADLDV